MNSGIVHLCVLVAAIGLAICIGHGREILVMLGLQSDERDQ